MLTRRTWTALILLGFAGQLAWAVENQYFSTFVYDKITPAPLLAVLPLLFTHSGAITRPVQVITKE